MKKHCNEQMSFFDQLQDDELLIVSCLPISCVLGPRDIIVLVITKEKSNYKSTKDRKTNRFRCRREIQKNVY